MECEMWKKKVCKILEGLQSNRLLIHKLKLSQCSLLIWPEQWAFQLSWRSWAHSQWCSCCHMDVTLADLIFMRTVQGLLVIHLPLLHRVSMATAAGLSFYSWMTCCIPFEWCKVWKMEIHYFATYICMYWFYKGAQSWFSTTGSQISNVENTDTFQK